MSRSSMSSRNFDPSKHTSSARGSFENGSTPYNVSSRVNAGNFVIPADNSPSVVDSASFRKAMLDRSLHRSQRNSLDRSGKNSARNSGRNSLERALDKSNNDDVIPFDIFGGGAGGGAGNMSARGNVSSKGFGGGNISADRGEKRSQRLSHDRQQPANKPKGNSSLNTPAKHTPGTTCYHCSLHSRHRSSHNDIPWTDKQTHLFLRIILKINALTTHPICNKLSQYSFLSFLFHSYTPLHCLVHRSFYPPKLPTDLSRHF